jgi:hypothetical protein
VAGGNKSLWFSGAQMMTVRNNTIIGTQAVEHGAFANGMNVDFDRTMMGLVWTNNILPAGESGIRTGPGLPGSQTFARLASDGDYRFNVLVQDVKGSVWVPRAYTLPENGVGPCCASWAFPPAPAKFTSWKDSWESVGFVSFNDGVTDPVLGVNGKKLCTGDGVPNPACKGASPFTTSPLDGTPVGANIDLVGWATQGAVSGEHNPWFDFYIRSAHPSTGIVYTAYSTESCRVTVSDDAGFASPIYDEDDPGGDRDRTISVGAADSEAQVKLPDAKVYYVRVRCDDGRYRETELRNY